jgi:beta-mannosidase
MAANVIADFTYRDNLNYVQWVEGVDWNYYTTFTMDPTFMALQTIMLIFEGLDTHAIVTLNGVQILEAHNQFRSWSIDVKSLLKTGDNSLAVNFQASVNYDKGQYQSHLPVIIPTGDDKGRTFSRKAAYQYGWDWGPRLVTVGIWRPVKLVGYDFAKLSDVRINQLSLNATFAQLQAEVVLNITTISVPYTLLVSDGNNVTNYTSLTFTPTVAGV